MCEWISSLEFAWIYLKKVENVVSLTCRLCHLLFSLDGLKETATSLLEVKTWRLLPKYGEKNILFAFHFFFPVNSFFLALLNSAASEHFKPFLWYATVQFISNPLTPRSDSHVTSPYNIRPLFSKLVMRVFKCIR